MQDMGYRGDRSEFGDPGDADGDAKLRLMLSPHADASRVAIIFLISCALTVLSLSECPPASHGDSAERSSWSILRCRGENTGLRLARRPRKEDGDRSDGDPAEATEVSNRGNIFRFRVFSSAAFGGDSIGVCGPTSGLSIGVDGSEYSLSSMKISGMSMAGAPRPGKRRTPFLMSVYFFLRIQPHIMLDTFLLRKISCARCLRTRF